MILCFLRVLINGYLIYNAYYNVFISCCTPEDRAYKKSRYIPLFGTSAIWQVIGNTLRLGLLR